VSEPERLLASGSALTRRLLESGTVERPPSTSLARTMATVCAAPDARCWGHDSEQQSQVRSRTRGRVSGVRQRGMVRGVKDRASSPLQGELRSRLLQWSWLALLAAVSLVVSAVLSYRWRAAPPTPPATAGASQHVR